MKYGSVTLGQVEDVIRLFFDKHGRRIPEGLHANVCDANRDFRLEQPELKTETDFANRISRLHEALRADTGITGIQLQQEDKRLRDIILGIPEVANVLKGVCLPVILSKRHSNDPGEDLELQLEDIDRSYVKHFKELGQDRKFFNHRKGELAGKVEIVSGSGYQAVWERRAKDYVIALFFPNPLQGYSIYAQREQMATLAKYGFILSGAVEPMAMYSDILARDWNTPGLDLAALQFLSADYSLHLEAYDDWLDFGHMFFLANAHDSFSGSLLFLG